jgi:hypothetical protein
MRNLLFMQLLEFSRLARHPSVTTLIPLIAKGELTKYALL